MATITNNKVLMISSSKFDHSDSIGSLTIISAFMGNKETLSQDPTHTHQNKQLKGLFNSKSAAFIGPVL